MTAVERYNALDGRTVSREELMEIEALASNQGQAVIVDKISEVLAAHEDEEFRINISAIAIDQVPFDCLSGLEYAAPDEEFEGLEKAVSPDDIYQMITDKMLAQLKEATGQGYKKKWKKQNEEGYLLPFNFDTKKMYRGINIVLLTDGMSKVLKNPFFLTFNQIEKHKGKLKKGSKGLPVVYFTMLYSVSETNDKGEKIEFGTYNKKRFLAWLDKNIHRLKFSLDYYRKTYIPILKYYNVFNGADIEGIDFDLVNFKIGYQDGSEVVKNNDSRVEIADLIVKHYPAPQPKLKDSKDGRAFFRHGAGVDEIHMPKFENFETGLDYYRTLFHEFTHSTGISSRLDRPMGGKFGSKQYAKEELVAEFGAVFLSAHAGIIWYNQKNHAEYLKNWNTVLTHAKDDNRFFMRAASKAQEAADYVLNLDKEGVPKYQNSLKSEPKQEQTIDFSVFEKLAKEATNVDEFVIEVRKIKNVPAEVSKAFQDKYGKGKSTLQAATAFFEEVNKKPKKRKKAAFKRGDKAWHLIKNMAVTIRKVYIPKKGSSQEHENRVYDITYSNGKKAIGIPESKLGNLKKEDPKPAKKEVSKSKNTNQLLEEQKKAKLQAKNKTEFEKGLKKLGLEVVSYSGKQRSPKEWIRVYKLNFRDIAGITLKMELEKVKNRLGEMEFGGTSEISGMGIDRDDYIYYDKISEFYEETLNFLKELFDMSLAEADRLKKEHGNTLFEGKQPKAQLGLFGGKEISTEDFKNMKVSELRKFALNYYNSYLKGRKVAIRKALKEVSFYGKAARKILKPMYKEKAVVIEHLEDLIKESTYNNWGDRKTTDSPDVLGYLNFKSKLLIDGEKRHVRISIAIDRDRKAKFKTYEVGAKEKSGTSSRAAIANPSDGEDKPLSEYKDNKNNNSSLNYPAGVPYEVPQPPVVSPKKHIDPQPNGAKSLAESMQQQNSGEIFNVPGDIGRFLGQVEKKPVHSVVTTLDAEQGAGKTRFLFQVMNVMAGMGLRCLFLSLEEHPASKLFKDKVRQYIDPSNLDRISAMDEIEDWGAIRGNIDKADVIFIDSFQKLPLNVDLDHDIRKAFNGKWFFVIYQQTGTKSMRGGSKAAFDGDQILKVQKDAEDYKNNYVYSNKNRYNDAPDLKLNIFTGKLEGEENPEPHPEISDSRDPIPKPTGRLIATPIE